MTERFADAEQLAAAVVNRVGPEIVLGLPVGLGKAVHVANALYQCAAADPSIRLTIFTALTLEVPVPGSDLERRFLEPLAKRLFGDWPALDYSRALRDGSLPANVRVQEFYFRPAAWLDNAQAQQNYASINYSQVAGELVRLGVNVVAQLAVARTASPGRLSLSSNPEVTLDLLPWFRERRERDGRVAFVGQVNRQLPYMTRSAELAEDDFDLLLDDERYEFPPFPLPNRAVGPGDYATGMHVASLVPDGGTVQVGIGSLSDAVAHCLKLRHESPDVFRDVLARLPGGSASPRRAALPVHTEPFREGLYACSELMSDALFSLFDAGIVSRPAGAGDSTLVHSGFFVGSSALYRALRELPEERRSQIDMTRISFVNTLFGEEAAKREQRRDACFINETMMATLTGAAVSDGLEDGRVVSGVGGQFDFVTMGNELEDGRSILMLRSTRRHKGELQSNIRWSYGHVTVPRHMRDLYVTEYGIAATRGQSDAAVIAAMLGIADAAFQPSLLAAALERRKIAADYRLPDDARCNDFATLRGIFTDPAIAPHFPRYPLGSEMTAVEQELADALPVLQAAMATRRGQVASLWSALWRRPAARHAEALARLDLGTPAGLRERVLRRLVCLALDKEKP